MLLLFICITKLAPKEIFSPSNKIHREVGWAKDLSAPLYFASRRRPFALIAAAMSQRVTPLPSQLPYSENGKHSLLG
jgi:hypothetical protein